MPQTRHPVFGVFWHGGELLSRKCICCRGLNFPRTCERSYAFRSPQIIRKITTTGIEPVCCSFAHSYIRAAAVQRCHVPGAAAVKGEHVKFRAPAQTKTRQDKTKKNKKTQTTH